MLGIEQRENLILFSIILWNIFFFFYFIKYSTNNDDEMGLETGRLVKVKEWKRNNRIENAGKRKKLKNKNFFFIKLNFSHNSILKSFFSYSFCCVRGSSFGMLLERYYYSKALTYPVTVMTTMKNVTTINHNNKSQ